MSDGFTRVVELHTTGLAAHARGRPRQALRTLRRAAALGEKLPSSSDLSRVMAAIAISVAATVAEIDGLDRGGAALLVARELAEQIDDPALLVKVHSQAAFIAARSGRFDVALGELDAAEQLITHAEPHEQFAILLNGGNLHMLQGDLAAARRRFDRAVVRARAQDRPVELFKALHNLGYAEFLAGRLPQAIAAMDAAGGLTVDISRSIWLLDRARVLGEAGLISAADASLADAARISRQDRSAQDLGEIELERARCALIAGEVQVARRFAMNARDRFRRRGSDRWRRSAELLLLQADLAAGRPGRRLTGPAHRLRAELDRDGARLPARTATLIAAEAHLSAGEVDAAASALAGLGRSRPGDPITTRLHTDYVRARFDLATGDRAAARRRARHGLADLAGYQARFGSIDLATAAAVHGRRLADLDLGLALASGRPERVLDAAERARAVATRLPPVRPPEDPQTAALLAELRQTVETLRALGTDGPDQPAVERLTATRSELEARIAARGWTRPGGGVVREVAGVEAARAALADATLVSFSRVGRALHAVVVSASGLRLVPVGDAGEIDEQVRRVRADLDVIALPLLPTPLRDAVQASLTRSLTLLDRALLAPLTVSGRLVVVSTGVLGQLPWGLLPGLRGVPVVVTPSVTAWLRAASAATPRSRRVVAIAGPGVGRGADEAAGVARTWAQRRPRRLTGDQATAAAVTDALGGARLAHVAAHGVHQTENPLFSSVRLADGPLFAHELDQSARMPDHVVLSACELGLATVRPGDEALGLTSVLLHLGTRCVVAGVARVGDESAASTMAGYHDRLRAGHDSALALAETLAELPRPQPFVCFGVTVVA
jgi:tetratricopeptide (TPR) repeat protein